LDLPPLAARLANRSNGEFIDQRQILGSRSKRVTNNRTDTVPSLPVANYSPAIARALDWLGDRYLLAKPINAPRAHRPRIAPAPTKSMSV
jgi:hypothetical protein